MTTPSISKTLNGVNVEQLLETIAHVRDNPDLARFEFRARNEWLSGGRSRTKIQSFTHAGKENTSRSEAFVLEGDEPPVLLGQNEAPNAVEAVLHALASCLAVGFVYNAAARGIKVQGLTMALEGELDLHGFLGLADEAAGDGRPGYEKITVRYEAEADAPREALEALCAYVQETSPVLDIIRNPVPVTVEMVS